MTDLTNGVLISNLEPATSPAYIEDSDLLVIQRGDYTYSTYINFGTGSNEVVRLDSGGSLPDIQIGTGLVTDPSSATTNTLTSTLYNMYNRTLMFTPPWMQSVQSTVDYKLSQWPSVTDFGANGIDPDSDTQGLINAMNNCKTVIIPDGLLLQINANIVFPPNTTLIFIGTAALAYIANYVITLRDNCNIINGKIYLNETTGTAPFLIDGSYCTLQNTILTTSPNGGGVTFSENGNRCTLTNVQVDHSLYGFWLRGNLTSNANTLGNTLISCTAVSNTSHGFYVQNAYNSNIINPHTETNVGYGIYVDGANNAVTSLPRAMYTNISSGNYTTNTAGTIFDQGGYTTLMLANGANIPAQSSSGGTGSAVRTVLGGSGISHFPSIYPNVTATYNLGTSGTVWNNVYGTHFLGTDITFGSGNALSVYETGTWTPADGSGAGLPLTSVTGMYIRIGSLVTCWGRFTYPVTANASSAVVSGLPYTIMNNTGQQVNQMLSASVGTSARCVTLPNTTTIGLRTSATVATTNADNTTAAISILISYRVS